MLMATPPPPLVNMARSRLVQTLAGRLQGFVSAEAASA